MWIGKEERCRRLALRAEEAKAKKAAVAARQEAARQLAAKRAAKRATRQEKAVVNAALKEEHRAEVRARKALRAEAARKKKAAAAAQSAEKAAQAAEARKAKWVAAQQTKLKALAAQNAVRIARRRMIAAQEREQRVAARIRAEAEAQNTPFSPDVQALMQEQAEWAAQVQARKAEKALFRHGVLCGQECSPRPTTACPR